MQNQLAPTVAFQGPLLEEWLTLPREEIARHTRARHLALMFSIDGSRRHYLLTHPERNGDFTDFDDYARFTAQAYVNVYDLLFELGVETILTSMLYPPNFLRGEPYLAHSLRVSRESYCHDPFAGLYRKWNVRARLYGDWQIAPNAAPIRDGLNELDAELAALTPTGERLLLLGHNAGAFNDEMIARTLEFAAANGRAPAELELRDACFPHGPEKLDILIAAGCLRWGSIVPPVLDRGITDCYSLTNLALDVRESTLRRILYDHLFLRWLHADFDDYTPDILGQYAAYYATHAEGVVGLGRVVGPGAWYPLVPGDSEQDMDPRRAVE